MGRLSLRRSPAEPALRGDHAKLLLDLLGGLRSPLAGEMILDLGCGQGETVAAFRERGLEAFGCDFPDMLKPPAGDNFLKPIESRPYRLPFLDRSFDFIVSWQVLEHVLDLGQVLREIQRVLKPGGISLHIFSGRYSLLEPHVGVPLATVIRNRPWLLLWSWLGIRNEYQSGKGAREIARENFAYLRDHTRYLPRNAILRKSREIFARAVFREDIFIDLGTSARSRMVQRLVRLSPVLRKMIGRVYLLRKFQTRVLVLEAPSAKASIAAH